MSFMCKLGIHKRITKREEHVVPIIVDNRQTDKFTKMIFHIPYCERCGKRIPY